MRKESKMLIQQFYNWKYAYWKKSDKCKIKRAKAIIQVKETIMQKVKDKIIPIILIAIMAVSGYKIVTYFYQAHEQKKIFTSIEKK